MSFPCYPKYKDSWVEWLEQVPKYWGIKKLKCIVDVGISNVDKHLVCAIKIT